MRGLSRLTAVGLILWSGLAVARPKLPPALQKAVADFGDGHDDAAATELQAFLDRGAPSSTDAGRAHLYLGLIRLNHLENDAARDEFIKALSLNSMLELPPEASPKAAIPFRQAREKAALGSGSTAPETPPEPARAPSVPAPFVTPLVTVQPAAAPEGPSHVLSLVTGGVGVAAVAAGFVFLGLSAAELSSAKNKRGQLYANAVSETQTSATEQSAANFLLGCGGGVVVAATVIFIVESVTGSSPIEAASKAVGQSLEGVRF